MADSIVMLALGDFRFGMSTAAYQNLERSSSWRWPSLDRIGVRPVLQYVGPGEESIHLDGVIFPHFRGGLHQLDAMRAEAGKGKLLMLVDGTGRVWGKFCITEVRETQQVFFANGQPRRVDFSVDMSHSGVEGV